MTPAVYITAALIGAVTALLGIGLKMIYDAAIERAKRSREDGAVLLADRKAAFDDFLNKNRHYRKYSLQLHELLKMAQRGEEAPPGLLESFPPSPMSDLVESLEEVRRLARTYAVIKSADAIVRLYADMASAQQAALDALTHPDNELTWFLLCRFAEDREREFVYAYRQELGLGTPQGAPIGYMSPRHPQLDRAERTLRAHVSMRRSATAKSDDATDNTALDGEDRAEVTPEERARHQPAGPGGRDDGGPGPEVEGLPSGRRGRPAPPEAAP